MTGTLRTDCLVNRLHDFFPASRELGDWFGTLLGDRSTAETAWWAPASVWEGEDGYHVDIDLPGVAQEDVELTFEQGRLQITAERKAPEGDRTNLQDERRYGKVTRLIALPDTADAQAIDARLAGGVLHVHVPLKPEAKPRQIQIRTA